MEDNLSAFLLTKEGSTHFIALDAGDIFTGSQKFVDAMLQAMRNQNKLWDLFKFPPWVISNILVPVIFIVAISVTTLIYLI